MNSTRQNALKASRSRSMARKMLRRLVSAVAEAVFPVKCLACGCFFHLEDDGGAQDFSIHSYSGKYDGRRAAGFVDHLMRRYLCAACASDITAVKPPFCLACGLVFQSQEGDNRLCQNCIASPKQFRIARAAVIYNQAFMNLIHCFKYDGKIQLAKPLGWLLLDTFLQYWDTDDIDLAIPVPLYEGRLKQRGFNQAILLIQNWKKVAVELNRDLSGLHIEKHALVRTRATPPQTGLGRKERMANIKNAVSVGQPEKIAGKRILLVDDVYTTGATVDECARMLLSKEAACVDVLTVARAMQSW